MRSRPSSRGIAAAFLFVLCFVKCIPVSAQTVQFTAPVPHPVGGEAQHVWIADVNRDGKPDLIVTSWTGPNTWATVMLLGNGDGTFQPAVTIANAYTIQVADFDNDGRVDLLATSGNVIAVYLGNGDGTFQWPITSTLPVGTTLLYGAYLGDFNHDRVLDVAFGGSVLLGNGNGTFSYVQAVPNGFGSIAAIADFNRDGNFDLFLSNYTSGPYSIAFGNGDGTFQLPFLTCGGCLYWGVVVAADFNEDGILDLVSTVPTGGFSPVLGTAIGNGDGTFQPPIKSAEVDGIEAATRIVVADFTGFGHLGLALQDVINSNVTAAVSGNGDGTFTFGTYLSPEAYWANDVAAADLNGDRAPDVVAAMATLGDTCAQGGDNTGKPCGVVVALNMRGTHVSASTLANTSNENEPVTFTVTVAASVNTVDSPTGTVAFTDRGKTLGIVQLAGGQASLTVQKLDLGTHNITAYYLGDSNFNPNWSPTIRQQVRKKPKNNSRAGI